MKRTTIFKYGLAIMLLILIAGTAMAQETQIIENPTTIEQSVTSSSMTPWFIRTVDSTNDVGQYASVAIDPASGVTYVSYYDATNKDLRMARYVGSGGNCGANNDWSCQTVDDSSGDVGKHSSIAIDPATGQPGIAYYDATNGELEYAYRTCAPLCYWEIDTIDEPILFPTDNKGRYASLKYHSDGTVYIAYYFEITSGVDALVVASHVGSSGNCGYENGTLTGAWQCDIIQNGDGVGQYASLALDGSGQPRVAYYHGGNNALMYAYQNGTTWTIREILPTDSGQYASLDVDTNNGDLPHIAHYDATNEKLEYAVYVGSNGNCGFDGGSTTFQWQCDEIASIGSETPVGISLAVDAAGYPIIAYQDTVGINSINIAQPAKALDLLVGNCGPAPSLFYTWYCEKITPLGPLYDIDYNPGDYIAVDVNSAGLATIAFYGGRLDGSDGNLRVTYQRLQVFLPLVVRE